MGEKDMQWAWALHLLGTILQPSLISYSSAILACTRSQRWEAAVVLLRDMRRWGPVPDILTWNTVVGACAGGEHVLEGGGWPMSLHLLAEMSRLHVVLNQVSHNIAIFA